MQGARGRMDGTSQRRLIHVVVIPDLSVWRTCDFFELLPTLFQSLLFVSMVVPRYLPLNLFPSAACSRSAFCSISPQSSEKLSCSNTYKFADSPPCRSLTFFPPGN